MDKTIKLREFVNTDKQFDTSHMDINVNLKTHQKVILQKCIDLEDNRICIEEDTFVHSKMGILADCVGSGKSYVILSLIHESNNNFKSSKEIKTYGNNKLIVSRSLTNMSILKCTIIIVPHNIFCQWQNYINVFGGKLKTYYISRTVNVNTFKEQCVIELATLDIILTTCSFYNDIQFYLKKQNVHVKRIVIDEADSINVTMSEEVDNSFIWFVTASYKNLVHPHGLTIFDKNTGKYVDLIQGVKKPGFMKNIFTNMNNTPGKYYSQIILKNEDEFVKECFELPEIEYNKIKCFSPFYIDVLYGVIDNLEINRLNALDTSTIVSKTKYNHGSENNIVSSFVSKFEIEKSNLEAKLNDTEEIQSIHKEDIIYKLKQRIQDVSLKITNINARIVDTDTCFVCYDSIKSKTVLNCCMNSMCLKCITLWMKTNPVCPICKSKLDNKDLFIVHEENKSELSDENTKLENLKHILKNLQENEKRQILIFSTYDNSFEKIINIIDFYKMKYSFLKGNQNFIKKTITEYNNNETNILLINPTHYGSGLNLETTTDIIMFHKFDSEIEKQVIGRAQRPGRKNKLNIWYLLHENEFF